MPGRRTKYHRHGGYRKGNAAAAATTPGQSFMMPMEQRTKQYPGQHEGHVAMATLSRVDDSGPPFLSSASSAQIGRRAVALHERYRSSNDCRQGE